jgi:putative transcriptional regulator|tara:strand:- start:3231 stop:3446 length:216 start_codon:yes stop_codon:yes gene_type:complete
MAIVVSGLNNTLKELRKVKGLTQADLASAAGVSRKTINTFENKVFVPSTVLALTLAKVLNVSVHEIFELET